MMTVDRLLRQKAYFDTSAASTHLCWAAGELFLILPLKLGLHDKITCPFRGSMKLCMYDIAVFISTERNTSH